MMKYVATIVGCLLFQVQGALAGDCEEMVQSLLWLESADPIIDAKTAIKDKDQRLMAVYGIALQIPGIEGASVREAYESGGHIAIEGTSDALCSDEHLRLNIIAEEYAIKYNKTILDSQ